MTKGLGLGNREIVMQFLACPFFWRCSASNLHRGTRGGWSHIEGISYTWFSSLTIRG